MRVRDFSFVFVFSGSVSVSALQNKALGETPTNLPSSMKSHLRIWMGGQLLSNHLRCQQCYGARLSPKGVVYLTTEKKKEPPIDGNQVYLQERLKLNTVYPQKVTITSRTSFKSSDSSLNCIYCKWCFKYFTESIMTLIQRDELWGFFSIVKKPHFFSQEYDLQSEKVKPMIYVK